MHLYTFFKKDTGIFIYSLISDGKGASLVAQLVKNLPAVRETRV